MVAIDEEVGDDGDHEASGDEEDENDADVIRGQQIERYIVVINALVRRNRGEVEEEEEGSEACSLGEEEEESEEHIPNIDDDEPECVEEDLDSERGSPESEFSPSDEEADSDHEQDENWRVKVRPEEVGRGAQGLKSAPKGLCGGGPGE
jgi:hypothetical protein